MAVLTCSRVFLSACTVALLGGATPALAQTQAQHPEPTVSALLKLLVTDGILTQEKADTLYAAAAQEAAKAPQGGEAQIVRIPGPAPSASPSKDAPALQADWGQGAPEFRMGDFRFKPRGRIMMDLSNTTGSNDEARNITATGARAIRLGFEGGVGPHLFYQAEADFADAGAAQVTSAYFGWRDRAFGRQYEVTIGQRLSERGIEGSSGSNALPFLERNVVGTAIGPQKGFYGLGVMTKIYGANWHFTGAVAGDDISDASRSDVLTVMERAHWNPLNSKQGALHLGVWGFQEQFPAGQPAISRSAAIGGRFNDLLRLRSGPLGAPDQGSGYGVELGGVWRSAWTFAEVGQRDLDYRAGFPSTRFEGYSVSAGWFLTGDKPGYNRRIGAWALPKVRRPVTAGGRGAVEVLARFESLDYTDAPQGGLGYAYTLGTNWYLTDFSRLMLNAIRWHVDNRTDAQADMDTGTTVTARAQISF